MSSTIASGAGLHPKSAGVLQYGGDWAGAYLLRRSVYMPWELDQLLDPDLVEEGLRRLAPLSHIAAELQAGRPLGDFDRVAALETSLYMRNQLLRDADWAGMAHSIEIRVPVCRSVLPRRLAAGRDARGRSGPRKPSPTCRSRRCPTSAATAPRPAS